MLDFAGRLQEYCKKFVREKLLQSLANIRELEYVRGTSHQRAFLSGKLEAYEEFKQFIEQNQNEV